MPDTPQLDDAQLDAIVEAVAERVRQRLRQQSVPPLPVVHGTWYDESHLRMALRGGAARIGSPSGSPVTAR